MSTIPSIFNERQITLTVLGGSERITHPLLTSGCLLLNRNGHQLLTHSLEHCIASGFSDIVCVMASNPSAQFDTLVHQFPQVHFVITREDLTIGDMINIGMAQLTNDYVLVLTDDLCHQNTIITPLLEKLLVEHKQFCVCPRLCALTQENMYDAQLENRPVIFVPDTKKAQFTVLPLTSTVDGSLTLFAADWVGLYNRKTYIELGGADYTITSEYWQKLDLFMRAWLWGEKCSLSSAFVLIYDMLPSIVDTTADRSYLRFYLKNLAPVYDVDHAVIPKISFFSYKRHASLGLHEAIRSFSEARAWTEKNKYRFKTDAALLIENWGK